MKLTITGDISEVMVKPRFPTITQNMSLFYALRFRRELLRARKQTLRTLWTQRKSNPQ